jgi:hypothetical protein
MALGFEPTSQAIQSALASLQPAPAPAPAPTPAPVSAAPPPAIRLRCSSRAQLADFCRKNLRAGHMTLPAGALALAPGSAVRILLALPDGITAELDAVTTEPPPAGGARIQFAPLSPDRRAALAALLDDPTVLPA